MPGLANKETLCGDRRTSLLTLASDGSLASKHLLKKGAGFSGANKLTAPSAFLSNRRDQLPLAHLTAA